MMLLRSAGRRQRRHTSRVLAASFAQLQLPWLAPAQLRWSASQASTAPSSQSAPRRRSISKTNRSKTQLRRLATAADQYHSPYTNTYPPPGYGAGLHNAAQDEYIPWDTPSSSASPPSASNPRQYDGPVMINTTTTSPSTVIKVQQGVSGHTRDLLAHLHTSLSVGRRDRAAAIIHRLMQARGFDAAELSYAHAAYLEESFRSLIVHGTDTPQAVASLQEMQKWFETEVRDKGVRLNGQLLVIMIRASIHTLTGAKLDRSIRKYSDMAKSLGPETLDDVLFSADYTDEEFTTIGRVTSEYFEVEEHSEEMPDDLVTTTLPEPASTSVPSQRSDALDLQTLPTVLPTKQKGLGLSSITRTMEAFVGMSALPADASPDARREWAYQRQQHMEEIAVDVALDRWRKADDDLRKLGINTAMQTKPIAALMWQWYQTLLPALERELAEVKTLLSKEGHHETDRHFYGPYMEMLSLPRIAANTILFTMNKLASGKDHGTEKYENEIKLNGLTMGLAKVLEHESMADASAKSALDIGRKMGSKARRWRTTARATKSSGKVENDNTTQESPTHFEWPTIIKVKLGAMLVSKLIETAQLPVTREHPRTKEKITQLQPAFLHRMRYHHGKKLGMIMPNPALTEKMQSEPVGSLIAKRMPMVVEPKPWKGWREGGYLHYSNPILRLPVGDKSGKDYFIAADQKGDLEKVYGGLTALGKVSWKVNHDVFRVQLDAWNSGEEIANLAPLQPEFDLPPEPDSTADPNIRRSWLAEIRDIENRRSGLHSKRCFQNFQLEVARGLVNETLYFPHNLDFRGRAYPIPPYLNHMGADNVRGLLTFAEGKELGPDGLRWLKIHLATVAGFDKASMEERVDYTMSHLDEIYDSVRAPLTGSRWWLEAEDSWQTLAACFELTKALDSPDPTKFVSHLPIQQDGTCNGLQHYAALGGDKIGAAQVNLEPGDRPADVYTAVAESVKEEVRRDAELGNEVARKLDGRITRKCVKQPVMTNVYGVTFYGARIQVRRQLEVLFPEVKRSDEINLDHMSRYIATKIFKCLGTMFSGAQAIQTWLGLCADRISMCMTPEQIEELTSPREVESTPIKRRGRKPKQPVPGEKPGYGNMLKASKPLFKSTVVWTTPLGLPVVQPYRASKARPIATSMQNLSLHEPQVWDPVSKRKQLQAFPPNFIHSLDATHMLLSALKCNELGLTFASIHDSFWTHASDVNTMSTVLRDAFVSMHSEDVIGRLREEFQARYKDCMYLATVCSDSVLGEQIKELRGHDNQRRSHSGELTMEVERLRLLRSDDPEERVKGEAMVTPGSLVASAEGESALALPSEMEGQGLGNIPENTRDGIMNEDSTGIDSDNIVMDLDTDADSEMLASSDSLEATTETPTDEEEEEEEEQKTASTSTSSSTKKSKVSRLYVWMPVVFPEVPQKGDFDVTRLRQSKYFFH